MLTFLRYIESTFHHIPHYCFIFQRNLSTFFNVAILTIAFYFVIFNNKLHCCWKYHLGEVKESDCIVILGFKREYFLIGGGNLMRRKFGDDWFFLEFFLIQEGNLRREKWLHRVMICNRWIPLERRFSDWEFLQTCTLHLGAGDHHHHHNL